MRRILHNKTLECLSLLALGGMSLNCSRAEGKQGESTQPAKPVASAEPARVQVAEPVPSAKPAPEPPTPEVPRVYAKTRNVWIRGEPTTQSQWIGFLWFGGSVELKREKPYYGPGCGHWYAVKPRGYVCADGNRATLDKDDPVLKGLQPYAPKLDRPSPHHYGESLGAERYIALPSKELMRAREWDLEQQLKRVQEARAGNRHESLTGVDVTPAALKSLLLPELPKTLQIDRSHIKRRSAVAWSAEVEHLGRSFLLSADMRWMPKDRIVPYPKVTFEGVHLSDDVRLPLAFFRAEDRPKYRVEGGTPKPTGKTFERLSWTQLTGKKLEHDDVTYLETVDGSYTTEQDAVVPTPNATTPWGAPVYEEDTTEHKPKGRGTWIEVSILGGWLIAYEGTKPVFVTMMSPGRGGPPVGKIDPLKTASTPMGHFKITGKFATATMVAPGDLVHSDVPWAQNFSGPHALHGAYWHNNWGNRQSGGCVNVSPIDGKWLYEFTEPKVPEGWHGVRWLPKLEPATSMLIHR